MFSQSDIKGPSSAPAARETIQITFPEPVPLEQEQGAFPTLQSMTTRTSGIAVQVFRDNLMTIIGQLQDALNAAATSQSTFEMDEAQFHLTVSAEGELSLLAKVGGHVGAGIVVTLRRKKSP